MITLQELCQHLDDFFDPSSYSDYGPNGLQVEGRSEISKIATAVSAGLDTIEHAIDLGADALIVHHGIFWEKVPYYPIVGAKRLKMAKLIESGLSLFGYHLPMDAHRECGNNWKAAKDLLFHDLEPFGEFNGIAIGVRGTFPEKSRVGFIKELEEYYQHPVHAACGGKQDVSTCAILSGGGYSNIDQAIKEGVDCFVTGSFEEYVWHIAHEEKINFLALGHAATECVGPKALAEYLRNSLNLDVEFLDVPNPF